MSKFRIEISFKITRVEPDGAEYGYCNVPLLEYPNMDKPNMLYVEGKMTGMLDEMNKFAKGQAASQT